MASLGPSSSGFSRNEEFDDFEDDPAVVVDEEAPLPLSPRGLASTLEELGISAEELLARFQEPEETENVDLYDQAM